MKYGYFDLEHKEYVITRPDTPAAWSNYLGDPEYGAIITNNAAGYSFVKSGANGRICRFRFNSMMALPGRYIYLTDKENMDFSLTVRQCQIKQKHIPSKKPRNYFSFFMI